MAQGSKEGLGQQHSSRRQCSRDGSWWIVTNPCHLEGQGAQGTASPLPQTLPMGPKPKEGQGGHAPDIPRMLSAWGYKQDTWGRDKGAPGDLPTAWHSPIPKGLPSATTLIFLPALTLGQPRGAHSLPTTHRAQFSNSAIA